MFRKYRCHPVYCIYVHIVWGGAWGSVGDHILQEFNTVEPTKCATHTQYKILEGEGAFEKWTPAAKSLYRSILLDDEILLWCRIDRWLSNFWKLDLPGSDLFLNELICAWVHVSRRLVQHKDTVLLQRKDDNTSRARICKRPRSPGIDSKESLPPAWGACTSNRVIVPAHWESIPRLLKIFTNSF